MISTVVSVAFCLTICAFAIGAIWLNFLLHEKRKETADFRKWAAHEMSDVPEVDQPQPVWHHPTGLGGAGGGYQVVDLQGEREAEVGTSS